MTTGLGLPTGEYNIVIYILMLSPSHLFAILSGELRAQFCLNPLTSFFGIFCLGVVFTNMNFVRFLIA
jgi:hypothetical protein